MSAPSEEFETVDHEFLASTFADDRDPRSRRISALLGGLHGLLHNISEEDMRHALTRAAHNGRYAHVARLLRSTNSSTAASASDSNTAQTRDTAGDGLNTGRHFQPEATQNVHIHISADSSDDVRFEYSTEEDAHSERSRRVRGHDHPISAVHLSFSPKSPEQIVFGIMQRIINSDSRLRDSRAIDLFYVKGGFVRDKLRGHAMNDMDMYVDNTSEKPLFAMFVRELVKENRLVKVEKRYGMDVSRSDGDILQVERGVRIGFRGSSRGNVVLHVDVGASHGIIRLDIQLHLDTNEDCDFTCNNLVLDAQGALSTRIKHGACKDSRSKPLSESDWLSMCVRDVYSGRLVVMTRRSPKWTIFDEINKNTAIMNRVDHMIALGKGYEYSGETVSGWVPRLPLDQRSKYEDNKTCAICHEDIDSYEQYLPIKCAHPLHCACALKWIRTGRTNGKKCPVCRAVLEMQYGEPYLGKHRHSGDMTVARIRVALAGGAGAGAGAGGDVFDLVEAGNERDEDATYGEDTEQASVRVAGGEDGAAAALDSTAGTTSSAARESAVSVASATDDDDDDDDDDE